MTRFRTTWLILLILASCDAGKTPNLTLETDREEMVVIPENRGDAMEGIQVVDTIIVADNLEIMEPGCLGITPFGVYLYDPNEAYTNVRNAPNGEVILKLPWGDIENEYMLNIVGERGGWFVFENDSLGEEVHYAVPEGFGWVHSSVIAVDTRNYAGQPVHIYERSDEESRILGTIEIDWGTLRPLKACGIWVKVLWDSEMHGKIKGWVKSEWLCGNPFTTCS